MKDVCEETCTNITKYTLRALHGWSAFLLLGIGWFASSTYDVESRSIRKHERKPSPHLRSSIVNIIWSCFGKLTHIRENGFNITSLSHTDVQLQFYVMPVVYQNR